MGLLERLQQPPELLNEQDYNMPTYFARLQYYSNHNRIILEDNNWIEGYESRWQHSLRSYNPGEPGYQDAVLI